MDIFLIIILPIAGLIFMGWIGSIIDNTSEDSPKKTIEEEPKKDKVEPDKKAKQIDIGSVIVIILFVSLAFGFLINRIGTGIAIFVIFSIGASIILSSENSEKEKENLKNEAKIYFDKIKTEKKLAEIPSSIFLEKGEKLLIENTTNLMEARSVRSSSGGFGGIRVAKGIRVGGYSGTSSNSLEWKTLDSGTLYLTTDRIIFRGNKENRNIELKDVFAFDSYSDSISLSLNSKAKNIKFTVGNPLIWSGLVNILKSVENLDDLSGINLNVKIE